MCVTAFYTEVPDRFIFILTVGAVDRFRQSGTYWGPQLLRASSSRGGWSAVIGFWPAVVETQPAKYGEVRR